MTGKRDLQPEERLNAIMLEENQGGDLQTKDYVYYFLLGVVFPGLLLIWGWY
ncbi:hypothetical protein V7087_00720 [Neobacillus niacini]|uniref:hypothetical protein n=1 Tax=Neobacillus niacini TaxID=86668 RepID=UPI002FFF10F8